jgi:hypothetical protein
MYFKLISLTKLDQYQFILLVLNYTNSQGKQKYT